MTNKKGITKVLQEYFSGGKNVAVVYLFGSFVSGAVHKFSDVDVGILLARESIDVLEFRLQTMTDLSKLLDVDRVDVVILNDATPLLKFEVVQNGELVVVNDDDQRCDFEVRARQEYFDVRPLLELQYHYMSKRLKEGKFGVKLVEN